MFGLALCVASTVVMLKAMEAKGLLETVCGRSAVGWLIVEDLAMVLVLVILPPTAIRPQTVSRRPFASIAFSITTVLATQSARPNTSAPPALQPQRAPKQAPSTVAAAITMIAPGTAMLRTSKESDPHPFLARRSLGRAEIAVPGAIIVMAAATVLGVLLGALWG